MKVINIYFNYCFGWFFVNGYKQEEYGGKFISDYEEYREGMKQYEYESFEDY